MKHDEEYFFDYEEVLNEETFAVEYKRVKKSRKIIDANENVKDKERRKKRFDTNKDGSINNPQIVKCFVNFL